MVFERIGPYEQEVDWIVLDSLLKSATEFHAELVTAKRKEQTSGYQKKQRTKW